MRIPMDEYPVAIAGCDPGDDQVDDESNGRARRAATGQRFGSGSNNKVEEGRGVGQVDDQRRAVHPAKRAWRRVAEADRRPAGE